jgi:hypothetical protein
VTRIVFGRRRRMLEAGERRTLRLGIMPDAVPPERGKGRERIEAGHTFTGDHDVSVFDLDLPSRNDPLHDVRQALPQVGYALAVLAASYPSPPWPQVRAR